MKLTTNGKQPEFVFVVNDAVETDCETKILGDNMAKRKKDSPSYESAMQELQEIVDQLQEEAVSVDDLSEKVKRAAELIQFCKGKLRFTETEIKTIFKD